MMLVVMVSNTSKHLIESIFFVSEPKQIISKTSNVCVNPIGAGIVCSLTGLYLDYGLLDRDATVGFGHYHIISNQTYASGLASPHF